MPRRRKTQSGADAQDIQSVSGQRYGEGVAQQQMQKAMPAPNTRNEIPTGGVAAPQQEQPLAAAPAVARPVMNPEDYLNSIPKGLLRNGQTAGPVTSGLSSGPGPGPEALTQYIGTSPMRRTVQTLYQRTRDPIFLDMLNKGSL